jgi:aryl-alcohol dehydrogenase-like predicted oxidoreductase
MQRRTFFGTVFSGLAAASVAKPRKPGAGDIPTRALGKTGVNLTCIGMGGARFHLVPFDDGVSLVRRAYDLGINYFDMARSYWDGRAEEVYGAAIPPFRKEIFLTTKSGMRTRKEAEAELDRSLQIMKTDYVDLWQMHGVNEKEDIEKIFAPGGALEAFEAARKAGKCRFFGFTGHADPDYNVEMLRRYDGFDTVLMPLHVTDTVHLSFEKNALPVAAEKSLGVLGMKIFGNAFLLRGFSVRDCLSYVLSLPVDAVTLGFSTIGQLEDDVRVAQTFKPLSSEEMEALRTRAHSGRFDVPSGPALEYWKRKLPT